MTYIGPATVEDLLKFSEILSLSGGPDLRGIKLVTEKGIEVMTGLDNWSHSAVQMHIWAGGRLTREYLRTVFEHVFITCDKMLAIGVTPGDNTAALEFNRRVGFRKMYEIQDGWAPGTSMVIQELRKHECIWIRGNHGTKHATGRSETSSERRITLGSGRSKSSNGACGSV